MADNIELSYPQMTRQREENIQSQQVANAEDVNAELDHIVETYNRLVMLLTGEWGDGTGRIYELVDNAVTTANEAKAIADNCVKKTGDTLTGLLSCAVVPNSDYNLVNKKYVDDKIITELADPLGRIESLENFRDNLKAEQVKLENANFSATNVHDGMTELFISVSSGKATVAAAITGKGVETAADASFKTMADNINAILTFNEGTSGGTATASDIISGKTAYARGQLIVGSLDLSTLHDTSDATATPYDVILGKVAYGSNGRIVGALKVNDDGSTSYDTAGVKKIYGYANDTVSVTTAYNDLGINAAPAIGVNKNTGDPVFKIEFKSYENGIVTFVTHLIERYKDGRFNYVNEKETTLDITDIPNYEDLAADYIMLCTQVSDCSNLNEVYLHFVLRGVTTKTDDLIVCKLKQTKYINEEEGASITHWEIDKEGGFWYKENISYISSILSRIVISSIGEKSGRYGVAVSYGGSSSNTGIVTYKLGSGNSIDILTAGRLNGDDGWGMFSMYLGYNDRFLSIIKGESSQYFGGIIWLSKDFTVQNAKNSLGYYTVGTSFISPDGNLLINAENVYDFRGVIENSNESIPNTTISLYEKIGTFSRRGVGIMSPSSNLFVQYVPSELYDYFNGNRTYLANTIDISKAPNAVTKTQTYGKDLGIIGDGQQRYDYFSNDGSIYWNTSIDGSGSSKREVIIKFERDYSELIALEYEGNYFYKVGYTGGLTPGGES